MTLKNIKKELKNRITDNKSLMGMVTLFFLLKGWDLMMIKESVFSFSLGITIFGLGFFNAIPTVLKVIDGKGIKGW